MFGETVRKDVSFFRVTETKALNKVQWKNKAHKGDHKQMGLAMAKMNWF